MELNSVPEFVVTSIKEKKYIGKIKDPDWAASIKGPCGDERAVDLLINNDMVEDIKFQTSGCFFTYACGTMVAHLAHKKTIQDVLTISPGQISTELSCLSKDHCHCAILAVSTLYKAIANYWLNSHGR